MPMYMDRSEREDRAVPTYEPLLHGPVEPTWGETFGATVGTTISEELSISSKLADNNRAKLERAKLLEDMKEKGYDLSKYVRPDGTLHTDAIVQDTKYPGLKTDQQVHELDKKERDERYAYAQQTIGAGPTSATLTGGFVGAAADPISLLTMSVGAPVAMAGKAATLASRVLKVAGVEAAINMAVEVPIQAFVWDYKDSLDRDYGANDVFANIAFAGGMGGVFGGAAAGIRHVAGKAIGERRMRSFWHKALDATDENGDPVLKGDLRKEAEAQLALLEGNKHEIDVEKFRAKVVEYSRLTSDELRADIEASRERWADMTQDERADVDVKRGLLEGRERVSRRDPANFEAETPSVLQEPGLVGPRRYGEVTRASDPEYTRRVAAEKADIEADIEKAIKTREELDARIAKEEKKKLPARKRKEAQKLKAEAEARIEELKGKLTVAEQRLGDTPAVKAEVERVAKLNAADEAFIEQAYQDALMYSDIDYMHQQQALYMRMNENRNLPEEVIDHTSVKDEAVIEAATNDATPFEEFDGWMARLNELERARGCL